MDAPGDPFQAFRAVPGGIHAGDDGKENLGGADVAGGLVAADVLLTGLEAETHGGVAVAVDTDADEAAGELAFEFVFHRHVGGVGTAAAHGDPEALGAADGDIRAPFAGRLQKGQGEEVGGGDNSSAGGVGGGDDGGIVVDGSVDGRVLQKDGEGAVVRSHDGGFPITDGDVETEGFHAGLDDGDGVGQDGLVDKDGGGSALVAAVAEADGLGGSGAFIKEGGVGDGEPGQFGDHGLVVEQGFETALGDFGLVGRVGGIPGGVFEDIPQDDGRSDGAVVTFSDAGFEDLVFPHDAVEFGKGFLFCQGGGKGHGAAEPDGGGDGGINQGIERGVADGLRDGPGGGGEAAHVAFEVGFNRHGGRGKD